MKEISAIRPGISIGVRAVALAGLVGAAVWAWQIWDTGSSQRDARPLEGLKVFGTVPDFSLIQRDGRRITPADLRGKVWIANFIYTHCTETCPLQSAQMARLQADFSAEANVRLVSFTVDPEQDTPKVLAEYAGRFGADSERWLFLTGEKRAIYSLAINGFHLGVADPEEGGEGSPKRERPDRAMRRVLRDAVTVLLEPPPAQAHPGHPGKPFLHSSRFVVVDGQARIRGYYHSNDEEALGRLRRDVRILLQEIRP